MCCSLTTYSMDLSMEYGRGYSLDQSHHQYKWGNIINSDKSVQNGSVTSSEYWSGCAIRDYQNCSGVGWGGGGLMLMVEFS